MTLTEFLILVGAIAAVAAVIWSSRRRIEDARYQLTVLQRDHAALKKQVSFLQQQMAALGDTAFDAMIMINAERQIVLINRAAVDLFGTTGQGETLIAVSRNHELDTLVSDLLKGEQMLESQIELDERSLRVRGTVVSLEGQ